MNFNRFDTIQRAFDENAVDYDDNSLIQCTQGISLVNHAVTQARRIVKSSKLKKIRVLDVGIRNGRTTVKLYADLRKELMKIFTDIDINFTGIDISPYMIKQSIENIRIDGLSIKNFKFYTKNAEELSVEDGQYDIIFSNATLHWYTPKVYEKLYERLTSNGILIVEQGGENCYKELHNIVREAIIQSNLAKYFESWSIPLFYPSQIEMTYLLENIGFKDVIVESHLYNNVNYKDLISAFANASLSVYLVRLPENNLKRELKNRYYELCINSSLKYVTVNRLEIIAIKP